MLAVLILFLLIIYPPPSSVANKIEGQSIQESILNYELTRGEVMDYLINKKIEVLQEKYSTINSKLSHHKK